MMGSGIRRSRGALLAAAIFAAIVLLCLSHPLQAHAIGVAEYAGETMFETAAAEAKAAYPKGSDSAVIVGSGDAWVDALSAAGLAASKGPILFTERNALHPSTGKALRDLGVKSVVIIGGTGAVSTKAQRAIEAAGFKVEKRLGGDDCYDTQMKIYEYGREHGLWDGSFALVATASHFGDALSASPVAFAKKAPIFLVPAGKELRDAQKQALVQAAEGGDFSHIAVMGGPAAVSDLTCGFLDFVAAVASSSGVCERVAGADQYGTSAAIANWAVKQGILGWGNPAISTGRFPYDALAGSVLQGRSKSVLLLADDREAPTVQTLIARKGEVSKLRFFGGTAAVPEHLRNYIKHYLGISIRSVSLRMSCMFQYPELPTGCESVALANDLSYYGFSLSKFEIADRWLPRSSWDFVTAYQGDPRQDGGLVNSCCAPALKRAANAYLKSKGSSLRAFNITGTSFSNLYSYLEQGYPVIVWNTVGMMQPGPLFVSRYYDGRTYALYSGTHTVVLAGFDRDRGTVEVVDSIAGRVTRPASTFKWIYARLGAQAIVIK